MLLRVTRTFGLVIQPFSAFVSASDNVKFLKGAVVQLDTNFRFAVITLLW